ncbi:putative general transcription factor II-I repeat domain-containing protein 2-like [Penaeus vannamei]|uniref:Putative general transcription factor II-I repeat domain-containing protein 2-like n=1 Tax=Penaeus vannamei TaxID=6689 RepID=A0A3R7QJF2_PENVA|nr:putative general transcription factor II-I repeat domain-containing protein 2-like [Penaeus vannamei]
MCEELAALQSLKGTTTGEDIFGKVYQTMEELDLDWSKLASITTDGASSMVGMSRGPLPNSPASTVLQSVDVGFCHEDMTEMLNSFNLQLQGQGKLICDIYSHTKAFEVKLELLLGQVKKHSFIHLPATQNLSAENPAVSFPAEKCVEALEMLKAEFGVRFRELHVYAKEIHLFQNPFVADIDEAQPSYQFELAELQDCDVLKDAFKPNSLIDFYAALPNDTYPNIRKHAMKMSTLFGSTYICEQTFSRMKLLKTPMRSRLTDEHLHQCLRLAVTKMEPDIQLLTSQMQAHSSH